MIVGGPTYGWVAAALSSCLTLRRQYGSVGCPVLVLQAEEEAFVSNTHLNKFVKEAPFARKVFFPRAFHALLEEHQEVRAKALEETTAFLHTSTDTLKQQLARLQTPNHSLLSRLLSSRLCWLMLFLAVVLAWKGGAVGGR